MNFIKRVQTISGVESLIIVGLNQGPIQDFWIGGGGSDFRKPGSSEPAIKYFFYFHRFLFDERGRLKAVSHRDFLQAVEF